MIIILEGPDLAGKTTFADLLASTMDVFGVPHVVARTGRPDPPNRDPYEEYEYRYDELFNQHRQVVIADRWHWGETVYGPLFRDRDRLGTAGWRHVELSMLSVNAMVVYLHETSTVLLERLLNRGDDFVQADHLCDIEVGYHWCLRNTVLPTLSLRSPTLRDAFKLVRSIKDNRHDLDWLRARYPSYVGGAHPDVLLVGEKRGTVSPDYEDQRAFVPRGSTSGRYLLEALPERLWPRVGITNALEEDVARLWDAVGRPSVVTLGRVSHDHVTALGLPHAAVPHPQWVRRFAHSYQTSYGELIYSVKGTERDELGWKGAE